MTNLAPVVLFVYNRTDHVRKTVEALLNNELVEDTDLIVYADGPKEGATEQTKQQIQAVREYVSSVSGFKSIELHFAEKNIGCADSIIQGVTETVNRFGKVIVVEDDIVTNRFFLRFMNEGLRFYEKDKRIFTLGATSIGITLPENYKYDVYLSCRSVSWGWATWSDRWALADWNIEQYDIIKHPNWWRVKSFNRGGEDLYDMLLMQLHGEIDAWDIRWEYCIQQHHGYTVVPVKSFASNCGMDNSGTHCGASLGYVFAPDYEKEVFDVSFVERIRPNGKILKSYHDFFKYEKVSLLKKAKRRVKAMLRKMRVIK